MATASPRALLAAAGGVFTALAFPPFDLPWLALAGLMLLFLTLRDVATPRAALVGFLYSVAFLGTTLWWLAEAISPFAWVALVAVQGTWGALTAVAMARVRRLRGWPLWVACLFSLGESVRASAPWGGMPWGRLGYSAVDAPWSVWVPVIGVAGTGAVLALLGCLLASVVEQATQARPRGLFPAAAAVGLVAVPTFASAVLPPSAWMSAPSARIAIVQGELPGPGTEVADNHRLLTEALLRQTEELAALNTGLSALDLVVWPENATALDPTTDLIAGAAVRGAVETAQAPLLLGAVVDAPDPRHALNQSQLWDSNGVRDRYTKQRLVPFGEYVPLRPLAERLSTRVAAIPRDMVPGGATDPIQVGSLPVATALCFDVAYDDVLRRQVRQGGELVTVQTSNAMFLGTAQLEQQWQVSRARALELGRSVAVSSVNGISGAIAPDGTVLERLPTRTAGSVVVDAPLQTSQTWAVRLGSTPVRLIWAAALIALLGALLRDRPASSRRPVAPNAVADPTTALPLDRTDTT